jgi:Transposase DDE domain
MCTTTKNQRLRPVAKSFLDSLHEFLTPAIWKQAEQARRLRRRPARWATQPLLLTMLTMTWCCGDSQAERFETAKGFAAVCLTKRRRPGQSVPGFQKAMAKLPITVLRTVAAGVRRRLLSLFDLTNDGWIVLGVDGSALECPRVAELEQRLDPPQARQRAPQIWVTALVHLRTGLLWAWHLGKGHNRERSHLRALLSTLPALTLIVADAGYNGYELAQQIINADASFLIRMSAKDMLYTDWAITPEQLQNFTEDEMWCWPLEARQQGMPLRVRLMRLRGKQRRKDVWLLTNVLDSERLSIEQASRYYRWRWENEGLFRTYKRTLAKLKLLSRTIRLVHREAEASLLATQLLMAQGVRGVSTSQGRERGQRSLPRPCSPRRVLLAIREVILGRTGVRQRQAFQKRLAKALREQRPRTSSKVKRVWPRRANHKPPKPPKLRELTVEQKVLLDQVLKRAP